MAYNFVAASSQRIQFTGSQTGILNFTANHAMAVSAWVRATTFIADGTIFGKGFNGSNATAYEFKWTAAGTGLSLGSYNGSSHGASAAHGFSTGVWAHCYGDYDGAAWHVYANGSLINTSVDAVGPVNNTVAAGVGALELNSGLAQNYFNGDIAELGVWDSVLSAGEILALSKGYTPRNFMRGQVLYAPFIRELIGPKGGNTFTSWTTFNTPTVVPHVRVMNARRPRTKVRPSLPPPPTTLFAQACL